MLSSISSPEVLQKLYDGSIDRFVDSWLGLYELHANKLAEPGRNEWADILHVTYLESDTERVFVTNDRKIRTLLNDLPSGSSIYVEELKKA